VLAAAWSTAVATGLLALFAVFTAWYARKAFREQSKEVGLLQQQGHAQQGEQERQAEERRREQAARVYVTTKFLAGHEASAGDEFVAGRGAQASAVTATVHNTSGQPVYDVRVHWWNANHGAQADHAELLGAIGPGQDRRTDRQVPDGHGAANYIPVAYFRDAAGLGWTVLPDGHLDPVDTGLVAGSSWIATIALMHSDTALGL
jgi:hypothetical protein